MLRFALPYHNIKTFVPIYKKPDGNSRNFYSDFQFVARGCFQSGLSLKRCSRRDRQKGISSTPAGGRHPQAQNTSKDRAARQDFFARLLVTFLAVHLRSVKRKSKNSRPPCFLPIRKRRPLPTNGRHVYRRGRRHSLYHSCNRPRSHSRGLYHIRSRNGRHR